MKARFLVVLALLFAAILPRAVMAQCSGVGGVPFNCANGSAPQVGDYVMGGSISGNNTVKWTIGQLFANPVSTGLTQAQGGLLVGTGTVTGLPYQFQSALDFDPSAAGASGTTYRKSMFNTTLTYATQDTTNVWEGLTSFITVIGPHAANGEINGIHSYLQFNSGATVKTAEGFESSVLNNGTITTGGTGFVNYLAIQENGAAGSVTGGIGGIKFQLTNDNSGAGSIASYAAIDMEALAGGGSLPTTYLFLRNAEINAPSVSLGGFAIGTLTPPSAGQQLLVKAIGHAGATFPVNFQADNGTHIFLVDDGSKAYFGTALQTTIDGNGNIVAPSAGNGSTSFQISGTGSWTANGATTACVGTVGPASVHSTVQEWLTFKDTGGTVRYIPAC